VRSEFRRARSRRLVWMLAVGGVIAIVVGMGIAAAYSTPASDTQIEAARAQYEKQLQKCLDGRFTSNGQLPPGYDTLDQYCHDTSGPYLSDAGVWIHDLPEVLLGISTFVVLLAAWLGASLGGADWTNNTMTTLLTWEPRRIRVLLTRAFVVAAVVAALMVFLQLVFVGVFLVVAALFGTNVLAPPDLWSHTAAVGARVAVMGVSIGLVAFAVAMVGRSTVASLGTLFGYLVLFEGVIAGFRPQIQSYLLVRAAGVIVSQQPIVNYGRTASGYSGSSYTDASILLDVSGAWIVVGVYVIGLLTIALLVFNRRDVT
jgi:ABC-2 type transport system permease protein